MTASLSRRVIGIGLKMYLDHAQTHDWLQRLTASVADHPALREGAITLFVLPTFPSLITAQSVLVGTGIQFGAQNLAWEDAGPFTGEVSGVELAQIGCGFVEIGHAERRSIFGEDDAMLAKKFEAAVRSGLTPVVCVGESARMDAEPAASECTRQLDAIAGAAGTDSSVIVAYEPVWAIGAAEPASAAHIRFVGEHLRRYLREGSHGAQFRVLYGGSARAGLMPDLRDAVDGLFLGRAAHDVDVVRRVLDECAAM
ncbi:triose-phosphate isomerase family protein [Microbacterium sp. UBA3394]|uniref:triose-phosphate isomerase family protein n=1 Tax=Microbacterium sp. UBA3394 TaxID=1946945 RepID=UPI000C5062E6|nr:triose-phosphate isomerase family protein [Microbacterium sp. UBA3394]MAM53346.1 triose-phosphate isomerase [Microbacterium sp.]|tara:strand:+ start:20717 stop:21481 length:765 start_codon:yes stop_codon:yes gene_type:complete